MKKQVLGIAFALGMVAAPFLGSGIETPKADAAWGSGDTCVQRYVWNSYLQRYVLIRYCY